MNIWIVLKYPSFWRVEQKGYLSLILIIGDISNNVWSEENNVTYQLSEWKFRYTPKLVCDVQQYVPAQLQGLCVCL